MGDGANALHFLVFADVVHCSKMIIVSWCRNVFLLNS